MFTKVFYKEMNSCLMAMMTYMLHPYKHNIYIHTYIEHFIYSLYLSNDYYYYYIYNDKINCFKLQYHEKFSHNILSQMCCVHLARNHFVLKYNYFSALNEIHCTFKDYRNKNIVEIIKSMLICTS